MISNFASLLSDFSFLLSYFLLSVHFVPLRQVGRAKRRGWIKPLTFHLPFVWQVVEKLLSDKFLSHTESTEFTDFFLYYATLALELTQLTRVEPTETLQSTTLTAPAESNTFTMATAHFVPLRQGGRGA